MTADLLPDFLIIGRPKCGSTSVARWLAEQPDICFCSVKEPRFFHQDDAWELGLDWYRSLFAHAQPGQLLGEATVGYTNPHVAQRTAGRIAEVLPAARLIYLVRDPIERIRSEFRHRRSFRTEPSETLLGALDRPDSDYAARTRYFDCLAPYIARFPREQILVVRMEDITGLGEVGWHAVLGHLGLTERPRPGERFNVSAERGLQARTSRQLLDRLIRSEVRVRLPMGVRRLGRRVTWRRGARFRRMLEASEAQIPASRLAPVWEDIARLEDWLGVSEPLWPRG
ncbi:MAG: sulfotransferase family protein [Actinomycetota bacterium]